MERNFIVDKETYQEDLALLTDRINELVNTGNELETALELVKTTMLLDRLDRIEDTLETMELSIRELKEEN